MGCKRFFPRSGSQPVLDTFTFSQVLFLGWCPLGLLKDRRAFVTRRLVFQRSLGRRGYFLNLEEGRRLSDLVAIAVNHSENLCRHSALRQAPLGILQLLVEEPLVDLDPAEARRLHGSLPLLPIQLTARKLVLAGQI